MKDSISVEQHSEQSNQKLYNCNFCKASLMLIIVLYHSMVFSQKCFSGNENVSLAFFIKWLATFHNYAFVLISGYIYAYLKFEKGRYGNFFNFIVKKAKRLLIPFFIIGYLWVFPIRGAYLSYSAEQILGNFILGINPGQLWFIAMLFWVTVIADYIFGIIGNNIIKSGFIVVVIFYLGMIVGNYLPNLFQIFTAKQFLPYFFMGVYFRKYERCIRNDHIGYVIALAWILNISLYVISQNVDYIGSQRVNYIILNPIMYLSGAIGVFLALERLAQLIKWNNKFWLFLCEVSFPIYLFHEQIIYFIAPCVSEFFNPIVTMFIVFILAMSIAAFISYVLMKRKLTRTMLGIA